MDQDKIKLFYTHEEVEGIARRALFQGELFGRNKEAEVLGQKHSFPMGSTFKEVVDNFLDDEGIHNSVKLKKS